MRIAAVTHRAHARGESTSCGRATNAASAPLSQERPAIQAARGTASGGASRARLKHLLPEPVRRLVEDESHLAHNVFTKPSKTAAAIEAGRTRQETKAAGFVSECQPQDGFVKPDQFVEMVYRSLLNPPAGAAASHDHHG